MGMERSLGWMPSSTIRKRTQTGYKRADFNLDGVVSNDDRNIFWSNNVGRCTAVAQGETILKPALKTHIPPDGHCWRSREYIFSASGGTGTITWAFVKNPSGGTNSSTLPHLDGLSGGNHFLVHRRAGGLGSEGSTGPGVCQCHQLKRYGASGEGHHRGGTQERGDPLWRPRTIWPTWPSTRCSTGAMASRISSISIP